MTSYTKVPSTNVGLAIWGDFWSGLSHNEDRRNTNISVALQLPQKAFNFLLMEMIKCCGSNYVYSSFNMDVYKRTVHSVLGGDLAESIVDVRRLILLSPMLFCYTVLGWEPLHRVEGRPEGCAANVLAVLRWYKPIARIYVSAKIECGLKELAKEQTDMGEVAIVLRGVFVHGLVDHERYLNKLLDAVLKYGPGPEGNLGGLTVMLKLLHDACDHLLLGKRLITNMLTMQLPAAMVHTIDSLRPMLLYDTDGFVLARTIHIATHTLAKMLQLVHRLKGTLLVHEKVHPLTKFYFVVTFELHGVRSDCRNLAAANKFWAPVDANEPYLSMPHFVLEMFQFAIWDEIKQLSRAIDAYHMRDALYLLLHRNTQKPCSSPTTVLRLIHLFIKCVIECYLPRAAGHEEAHRNGINMLTEMLEVIGASGELGPIALQGIKRSLEANPPPSSP